MSPSNNIAIIGAGLMGTGLVRIFRQAQWNVSVCDPLETARHRMQAEFPDVSVHSVLEPAVSSALIVIEAASEIVAVKQAIFDELVKFSPQDCILTTNSSVIPVQAVSAKISDEHAPRILGTHFWNPADIIPLVEVIEGPRTASVNVETVMSILKSVGKEPIRVQRDVVPGNRLQQSLWREAMALVDEGVCTPEDVDHIIKRSFGLRLAVLGPLENADLVGLDLTQQIHEVVLPTLSRATEPSPGLMRRRAAGHEGIRTGAGFYSGWTAEKVQDLRARLAAHLKSLLAKP